MSSYLLFIIIVSVVCLDFVVERILEYVNIRKMSPILPPKLEGIYDNEKYSKFQAYKRESNRLGLISSLLSFLLMLAMLLLDGFAYIDSIVRIYTADNNILTALFFFGVLILLSDVISLPLQYVSIFKIEEKYGFNKMTMKTFILDKLKSWLLGGIIGGLLLSGVIALYEYFQESFWYYAWIGISLFSLLMMMFYSELIVPLFNKQIPLQAGSLRNKIEEFAERVDFKLRNIYVIDGSKRSTKANAYFTGLGSKKRIVLYDTLINDLEEEEIVAVLAHETGHYKYKHTLFGFISSVINTGFILFLFSLIVSEPNIYAALGVEKEGIHISLIVFGILLTPLNFILGIFMNMWSRYNEYQADNFAGNNYDSDKLISALKKISVKALSNLTPASVYEFVYYSHPSLLKRINNLQNKQ